jgi:hypothetical protein
MRNRSKAAFLCCIALLLLSTLSAPSAAAFEPYVPDEPPPPEGCLGSNDPYCDGGGGGGGGWSPGCKECFWFPDGPNGEPGGNDCILASEGGYVTCTIDQDGYCDVDGLCQLV